MKEPRQRDRAGALPERLHTLDLSNGRNHSETGLPECKDASGFASGFCLVGATLVWSIIKIRCWSPLKSYCWPNQNGQVGVQPTTRASVTFMVGSGAGPLVPHDHPQARFQNSRSGLKSRPRQRPGALLLRGSRTTVSREDVSRICPRTGNYRRFRSLGNASSRVSIGRKHAPRRALQARGGRRTIFDWLCLRSRSEPSSACRGLRWRRDLAVIQWRRVSIARNSLFAPRSAAAPPIRTICAGRV